MIVLNLIIDIFIIVLCLISSIIVGGFNFIHKNIVQTQTQIIINNFSERDSMLPHIKSSVDDLVLINSYPNDIILDLRYASKNNFTGEVLYDGDVGVLHKKTFEKLLKAHEEFKSLGYKIKIWDAYRPFYIQKILWDILPNPNYIANPYTNGSNHNRACAVDVTLTDLEGNEILMPTEFDDFSERAHRNYFGSSDIQIKNAELLKNIMIKHGFTTINTEWWHFDDENHSNYPIINIGLSEYARIINYEIKGGENNEN